MAEEFIFQVPNFPEEFGVVLASPELRRLDFSALDFPALNRAGIEYIRTYFPNDFNDFVASNGVIMLLEIVAYIGNILSERSDILIDEAFLPTAQTKEAVIQHLELIGQKINRPTPAVVDIEITLPSAVASEIRIPPGIRFSLVGPDGSSLFYEVYRAPGDFVSDVIIPSGKRGVIGFGIEGHTETPIIVTSPGGPLQSIDLPFDNVLDEPITVEITTGSETKIWRRVQILEKATSTEEVFEVKHLDGSSQVKFGDNVAGKAPLAGQIISVVFRTGGGIRGRIGTNIINEIRPISPQPPATAVVEVLFRNPIPSSGGTDEETIAQAKARAPKEFATHNSVVTGEDYGLLAATFKHPVFGAVAKAVAIIRTGVDQDLAAVATSIRSAQNVEEAVNVMRNEFINRNIVELYVLAEGVDGIPVKPNSGLKRGLVTFLEELNVLTDEVRIFDGAIKPVDVKAIVVVSRSADAGTVKVQVNQAIVDFFNIRNFDMGTPLYLSNLYQVIQTIPGVKFVNIFEPADDIDQIDVSVMNSITKDGVAFNELITLGNVDLKFFFEPGNFKIPPTGQKVV